MNKVEIKLHPQNIDETIQKIQAARGQFTNWFIFVVIRYNWMIWGENRVL